MSFVAPALNVLHTVVFFAAENEEEFDPNKVTSGPAGFIATAVMAIAVISLGILLVRRLRRNQYRFEAREAIAEELAANEAAENSEATGADLPEATDKPADKEGGEG